MTNWKKLVGKRCLVTDEPWESAPDVYEITVLEVSPSGRVKVQHLSGSIEWVMPEEDGDLTLVEELE